MTGLLDCLELLNFERSFLSVIRSFKKSIIPRLGLLIADASLYYLNRLSVALDYH